MGCAGDIIFSRISFMSDKPLKWLDNMEEYVKKHILRNFRTKVNLLESFISGC